MSAEDPTGPTRVHPTTGVDDEDKGPIGLFPSWRWVYGTVVVYGVIVIGLLILMTRILDPGTP